MLRLSWLAGAARRPIGRAVVVSAVTLALLLIAWRGLGATTQLAPVTITPVPVVLALLGCGLFLVGRAWRLRVLLDGRAGFAPLLATVGISWGSGLMLPGPSADATFIVLARRRLGIGVRRGTSVSVLARLLDVISLAAVVVVAATISTTDESSGPIVAAAIVGGVVLLMLVLCLQRRGRRVLVGLLSRWPRTASLAASADEALGELGRPRRVAMLCASTALCRLATLLQYSALFALLRIDIDPWEVWFVLAVRTILSTIPIQGLAGLGTGQIWWTSALVLEGIGAGAAVGISITLSLLDIVVSIPPILACWGLATITSARARPALAGVAAQRDGPRPAAAPRELKVPL
jgi:hypothetical protein